VELRRVAAGNPFFLSFFFDPEKQTLDTALFYILLFCTPFTFALRTRSVMPHRLASRLLLSHALPLLILLSAVVATTFTLARVYGMIVEIREDYLDDIAYEERLHRAAWAVETQARHAMTLCEADASAEPRIRHALQARAAALSRVLQEGASATPDRVGSIAQRYLNFAEGVVAINACRALALPSTSRERLLLDENLTDAWIARLREVHSAIQTKEVQTQGTVAIAIVISVALVLVAIIAAALIAQWVARGVTVPLKKLAKHARQVGEGNFEVLPPIEGTYEVRALRDELDRMRMSLAKVDELKQAFIASVSHDLRTPLAQLRQALSLLQDDTLGTLTDRQQRVIALAHNACEREISLVSTLLDFSRVRAGKIQRELCSIDTLVEIAVDQVRAEANEAAVHIELEDAAPLPEGKLDMILVERALVNLLNNAISASAPGGTVRVERSVVTRENEKQTPSSRWVQIIVRDTGTGITPELRAKIFEPFFTKGPSAPQRMRGIGLGLPLARAFVRAHGGDIQLLGDTREGAAFAMLLPLDAAHSLLPISPDAVQSKEPVSLW